jgi:hypothetical protein
MAENSGQQYLVRDPQGNVYGPADAALLREWVAQGRIVAGMHIAPRETGEWVEVSVHPELAGCFATPAAVPAATEPAVTPTPAREQAPVTSGAATAGAAPAPAMAPDTYTSYVPQENSQATVSLIAGIVATAGSPLACLCGCVGGPVVLAAAVTAIITGIVALNQIQGDPMQAAGRRKAVAGIALGIGGLFLALAGVAAMVLVMSHK